MKEIWQKLLSNKRDIKEQVNYPDSNQRSNSDSLRSPYLVDVDRLIYSPHFRKLQDKTQVHPLAKNDYVRTRLTHSLEVSGVGRSLGFTIGETLVKEYNLENISEHEFGYIMQGACLAHDIGNPPFGHLGESAIKEFFEANKEKICQDMSDEEYNNLTSFDGNSQGFRIITKLAGWKNEGGLRLTYATLGAFLKYPCAYVSEDTKNAIKKSYASERVIGTTKVGVFKTEFDQFHNIATTLGLKSLDKLEGVTANNKVFFRHPLAFLTEAADDICYSIADIEDAFFVGLINLKDVEKLLAPIARSPMKYEGDSKNRISTLRKENFYKELDEQKKVEWLRGKSINNLIQAVQSIFLEYEKDILETTFNCELLTKTVFSEEIKACKEFATKNIYTSNDKVNSEIKGIHSIQGVLEELYNTIIYPNSVKSIRINRLLQNKILSQKTRYQKIVAIIDIVSDFTDHHIVNFYKILKGV